jgi:hypothetical protein
MRTPERWQVRRAPLSRVQVIRSWSEVSDRTFVVREMVSTPSTALTGASTSRQAGALRQHLNSTHHLSPSLALTGADLHFNVGSLR